MSNTMQAIRAHDYGGPEVLSLEEAPRPQPQAGQVLVRLSAAGVNPADWKYLGGAFKQFAPLTFPWIPGLEGAGTIAALGPGVTKFQVGQAVYGRIMASYAEYAVAPATDLQPKPEKLSFEEAASLPTGALTAWVSIAAAGIQPGQRVLVHGAAGGVGLYVVQLARWKGAQVIGTASRANLDFVRALGAEALDYNAAPFETVVNGLDAVIDTVGGDLHERSMKVIRPGGVFVTIAGRPSPELGKDQGIRVENAPRLPAETLKEINELVVAGRLEPCVGRVFPLSEAHQALKLSLTGHGRGRILLQMPESETQPALR